MIRRRQEGEKKQKNDTRGNQNCKYDETTSMELKQKIKNNNRW